MANNSQRVRCLVCDSLVQRGFSDSSPYAVTFFKVDKRRGCICSSCVDDLYARHNFNFKLKKGLSKRSTFQEILPVQNFDLTSQNPSDFSAQYQASQSFMLQLQNQLINSLKQFFPIPVTVSHAPAKNAVKQTTKPISIEDKYACLDITLDDYFKMVTSKVYGQDEAVRKLNYTIYYNQFVNLLDECDIASEGIKRNNIIFIGNTGCGKTFLAKTVAEVFRLPYAFCNTTSVTSAGYIGGKIEDFLVKLYLNSGMNLELAQNGIIFIDEVDKKRAIADASGKDVTGRSVQEELLKLLESSVIHLKEYDIDFCTKNLTIVLMGAFVGLDDVIAKRLNKKSIGFKSTNSSTDYTEAEVTSDDLIKYGIIPEFIGRIPAIVKMNALETDMATDILYSVLSNTNAIFKAKHVDLIIDPNFINYLAETIVNSPTGARDVDRKVYNLLYPCLYRVFQCTGGGIVEIDAYGNYEMILNDANNRTKLHHISSSFNVEDWDAHGDVP
ncbi:MAG: AAA family ATPase [Clostridia bacterium]|nr:AAA family ATPase [Clostridia bacterium]